MAGTNPPRQAPYPFLKRLMDRLIPLFLLALFSPVIIAVFIGMTANMLVVPADRGGYFYRERRISRGKEFDLLKFRVLKRKYVDLAGGHARRYERQTANLTWAGRYLKKWYLDELPQLLNIFIGQMSLVGPRPWPLHMAQDQLERGVDYRQLVHAGWTGPAQLQKGSENPQNAEKLDLEYLDHCRQSSAWDLCRYDLRILYDTIRVMAEGKGLKY